MRPRPQVGQPALAKPTRNTAQSDLMSGLRHVEPRVLSDKGKSLSLGARNCKALALSSAKHPAKTPRKLALHLISAAALWRKAFRRLERKGRLARTAKQFSTTVQRGKGISGNVPRLCTLYTQCHEHETPDWSQDPCQFCEAGELVLTVTESFTKPDLSSESARERSVQ